MPWINNLKLMPKLLLTFGVLLLVMLLQGIVAYRGLHSLNNVTTELAGSRMESIRMAGEMRGMLGEYRNAAYQQLIRASDDVKADARKQTVELRESMDKSIKGYPTLVDNPQQKKLFDTFAKEWKDALASYDSVTEMLELDLPDDAIDTFVGETRTKHRNQQHHRLQQPRPAADPEPVPGRGTPRPARLRRPGLADRQAGHGA